MQLLADGSSLIKDSWPHTANVVVHVLFGTLALVLGLVQLVTRKGGASHRARGRWFLGSVWIVVGTATTGNVLFRPRADLVAVTLLTAYWAWSGLRALRIRHVGPVAQDAPVSVRALVASVLLVLYLQTVRATRSVDALGGCHDRVCRSYAAASGLFEPFQAVLPIPGVDALGHRIQRSRSGRAMWGLRYSCQQTR